MYAAIVAVDMFGQDVSNGSCPWRSTIHSSKPAEDDRLRWFCQSPQRDDDLSRPSDPLYFVNTTASELHQAELHNLSTLGNHELIANIIATAFLLLLAELSINFQSLPERCQSTQNSGRRSPAGPPDRVRSAF